MKTTANMAQAAERFLKTGAVGTSDPSVLADHCNQIVRSETQKSINKAIRLATNFVKHSRKVREMPLQIALRSLGWALHMGGKYARAERAYLEARDLVKRDYLTRGRIDRILIDVYMYLGKFSEARKRARLSISNFEKHGANEEAAKTRVNLANLYHRQDRHREANRLYRQARKYFETHGGDLVLALTCYNEANSLVQLFEFDKAESLYTRSGELFAKLGYDLYVNESRYGLSWLNMLKGNYHEALKGLSRCEKNYRNANQPKGEMLCQLDRAEAYLGLNLFGDARQAARMAEQKAVKLGIQYESSKAAFFYAMACMAMGREKDAGAALSRAESGFKAENNQAFASVVQLFSAQHEVHGSINPSGLAAIRKKFSRAQLPLWEAICDLQLLSTLKKTTSVARRLASNPAVNTVPHLYAQWHTYLGDRDAIRGNMTTAARHWTVAADRLDAVRAKLPPVEFRSKFMHQRTDPYLKLVNRNVKSNPAQAAAWSERYKTAGVWAVAGGTDFADPVRSRLEQSLAELAEQVTIISGRVSKTEGKRSSAASQSRLALEKLQSKVRHDLAELDRMPDVRAERLEYLIHEIETVSRKQPVIQFHNDRSDLIAFVHHNGETRSHCFRGGRDHINEFMGCWNVLLGRSLLATGKKRWADIREERRLFEELGTWLWEPLDIPTKPERLLIIPEGRIANLPWMAVVHNGLPLACQYSITLSPSLRHHSHAAKRRIRSDRIEVYVGKDDGLSHAGKEVSAIADSSKYRVRVHQHCRRDDWQREGNAWIWHYAGHAEFRGDNPFYSSLLLDDGPMFAADFRLKANRVELVTLAACRTGSQSILPGEESTGLVRSLLEMGARNVVGSHWNVSDKSTSIWMRKFYKSIIEGERAAESVRQAALFVREKYPSAYDWAAFSVFGAG